MKQQSSDFMSHFCQPLIRNTDLIFDCQIFVMNQTLWKGYYHTTVYMYVYILHKNIKRHTVHTIVSYLNLNNSRCWHMGHISELMMIIRLSKLNTHSSSRNLISRRIQYDTYHKHNISTISQMYSSGGCQGSAVAHRAESPIYAWKIIARIFLIFDTLLIYREKLQRIHLSVFRSPWYIFSRKMKCKTSFRL